MSPLVFLVLISLSWSLTLEEIKRLTVKNHIDSVNSSLELKKLEEKIKEVRAGILPTVIFSLTYTRWDTNYISSFVPADKYFANLRLEQKVFDRSVWEAIKLARHNRELQSFIREEVKQKLLAEVEKLYWAVLLKKEVLKEREESLIYWRNYFQLVKEKYETGIVPRYEFLRARAQLRKAKADLIKARSELKRSLNLLKSFLRISGDVELEGELRKIVLDVRDPFSVLFKKNPTLRVVRAKLKVAESRVSLSKVQYFPKLKFFFNYNFENIVDFEAGRLKEDFRHGYNLGLRLDMTLYDGGRRGSIVSQERIQKKQVQEELDFTEIKLRNELEILLMELKGAQEELLSREDSLLASREALKFATQRYTEGVGSQLELLEARRNYEQAKLALLSAIYNYNSIVIDIKKLLGEL